MTKGSIISYFGELCILNQVSSLINLFPLKLPLFAIIAANLERPLADAVTFVEADSPCK